MVAYGPVFCDITWGAGGTTADVTLDIATRMQTQVSAFAHTLHRVLMAHRSTCTRMLPCCAVATLMHRMGLKGVLPEVLCLSHRSASTR